MSILAQPVAPQWSFTLAQPAGGNVGALLAATTRKLTFYLDAAATASFTMPGQHPETALVNELAVDVIAARNGVNLFRGRVGNSTDTLTADTITTAFTALDYRGMLGRRLLWSGVTRSFRQADQADIAWQMISDTQALPGGNLGIVRGAAPATGTLRDRDYDAGKSLGEALDQLGQTEGGFNWEIDASRNFNLFYPSRGRQTGLVLAYGRDVTGLARSFDATTFANAIRFNGSATTTADEVAVTTFDPQVGRWDGQRSDPNVVLQTTVDQRSAYELAEASIETPAYQVTMTAGRWDPANIWVGDTVQLVVQDGRLDVNTAQRVVQIDVTLSDDGDETVVLSVQAAPAALTSRLVSYNSRLNNLERVAGYIPDVPVGGMYDWPGPTPPALTMWCDGSALSVATYPDLFAVLGTTYGGDGVTTFNIPDCRGRMTVAAGSGTGLTARTAGAVGGLEGVALDVSTTGSHNHANTTAESPPHGHNVNFNSTTADVAHNHGNVTGASQTHTHSGATLNTGIESASHTHNLGWSAAGSVASGPFTGIVQATGNTATSAETTNHGHTIGGSTDVNSVDHVHGTANAGQTHVHGVAGATSTITHVHGTPNAGGGAAHENMPPWIAIGKVIKVKAPQNQ